MTEPRKPAGKNKKTPKFFGSYDSSMAQFCFGSLQQLEGWFQQSLVHCQSTWMPKAHPKVWENHPVLPVRPKAPARKLPSGKNKEMTWMPQPKMPVVNNPRSDWNPGWGGRSK